MADGRRVDTVQGQINPPPPLTRPPPLPPPPRALASQPPPGPPLRQPPPLPPPPRAVPSQSSTPPLTQPPPHCPPPQAPLPYPPPVKDATPVKAVANLREDLLMKDNKERESEDKRTHEVAQGLGKRLAGGTIKMKLKQQSGVKKKRLDSPLEKPLVNKPLSNSVAAAFGSDSEDEEDMPAEAKLRMRNVGKNTPTSAGPNSFNKSRSGFSDPRGSWRNELTD